MMPDNQDPHRIINDSEEKMIREAVQVCSTEVLLADGKRFRALCHLYHEAAQLAVEVIGKLRAGDPFVILHDRENIGLEFWMEVNPHQLRRAATCWSRCSKVVPMFG